MSQPARQLPFGSLLVRMALFLAWVMAMLRAGVAVFLYLSH